MPDTQLPALTLGQKQRAIARLQQCLNDLEAFDPQKVQKRYKVPEVMVLQAAIEDALSAAFGERTPAYNRYSAAARLDSGPQIVRPDWAGTAMSYETQQLLKARQYLAEGKERSIALLKQAIRTLENDIGEVIISSLQTSQLPPAARIASITSDAIENQTANRKVARTEKTVFISYRRPAVSWAQSIFQDLTHHGYDVFFDFRGLASGDFEEVIFENIKARAHFLVLLTPSALERCHDARDLFRREIETAIATQRNIVPIMLENFDFSAPEIDSNLGESLTVLKRYNGLVIYAAYFQEAMNRLREGYLNVPLNMVLHPASSAAEQAAKEDQAEASRAPTVSERELRQTEQARYLFTVKIEYQDDLERIEGTRAVEPYPGSLVIYDGESVVARYPEVERWSRQKRQP